MLASILTATLLLPPALAQRQGDPPPPARVPIRYLVRRLEKSDPERGLWRQAELLRQQGLELLEEGVGAESLRVLKRAELLYLATFDAAAWDADGPRFPLAVGEALVRLGRREEALEAFARALALVDPAARDEPARGAEELDELLAELDRSERRQDLIEAQRELVIRAQLREIERYPVDIDAPPFALPRVGGDSVVRPSDLAGRVALLWFWRRGDPGCERELLRIERLARRWKSAADVTVLGVVLDPGAPATLTGLSEELAGFLEERRVTFPQLLGDADTTELFLVLDAPAAAVLDADGRFRYASSGYCPFTSEALARAVEGLRREARRAHPGEGRAGGRR